MRAPLIVVCLRRISIILCYMICFPVPEAFAEEELEIYNSEHGLSQGFVMSVIQDRHGFLWIATKSGLNRFDGRQFRVFSHNRSDSTSLSHNFVSAIAEYGEYLLVGTNGGGLNFFHRATHRFYRMPQHLPGQDSLDAPGVRQILTDARGNIWLLTWREYLLGSLYKITLPANFQKRTPDDAGFWDGITVHRIDAPSLNRFTLSHDRRTVYFTPAGKDVLAIDVDAVRCEKLSVPGKTYYLGVVEDERGGLWVVHTQGLLCRTGNTWKEYKTEDNLTEMYPITGTDKVLLRRRDFHTGLYVLDAGSPHPVVLKDQFTYPHTVTAIEDKTGNLWIGTNGYGLAKRGANSTRFTTYFRGKSIFSPPAVLDNGGIICFEYSENILAAEGAKDHTLFKIRNRLPFLGNGAQYLRDPKGRHWLLYPTRNDHTQLTRIDNNGDRVEHLVVHPKDIFRGFMTLDSLGNLWVAHGGQLLYMDADQMAIKRRYDYQSLIPVGHEVRSLLMLPGGKCWIGTSAGLIEGQFRQEELVFNRVGLDSNPEKGLLNHDIACLYYPESSPEWLWIGTKGGGVARMHVPSGKFQHMTTSEGLVDDVIYGILPGDEGSIWMSSNNGLMRYLPDQNVFRWYSIADGLPDNEFNTWAYTRMSDGRLMFGGINGLVVFNPKDFSDNPHVPDNRITRVSLDAGNPGNELFFETPEELNGVLRIPFDHKSITFQFASLEFTAPAKNRFRYYLEGAEKKWAHEGIDNSAQYLNLPPGRYVFKVISSNNDGVWGEKYSSLEFIVLPPWYLTWWAIGIWFFLAAGLAVLALRMYMNRRLQAAETKRLAELDKLKTDFYTNITHEFRTPLTVILGILDNLKNTPDDIKSKVALAYRNGENLLDLINQMLDLSKLEANRLCLNLIYGDITAYIRYVAESFQSLAHRHSQRLVVVDEAGVVRMDFDPEKVRQIVTNLISNAIKFTPAEGHINVKTYLPGADLFGVAVSNTGQGIDPSELPHLFDRFYQSPRHRSTGGTGIGLTLTRELVRLMEGRIEVQCDSDNVVTFTITLPIRHQESTPVDFQFEKDEPQPEEPAVSMLQPQKASSSRLPRVLVVEDNADVVDFIRLCLSSRFRVDYAFNGLDGLEKACDQVPELIISDIMMPGIDGLELCSRIKNDFRTSHIPVIILTAKVDTQSRVEGLKQHADAYLAKPFHTEELIATIEQLLENRKRLQVYYNGLLQGKSVQQTSASTSGSREGDDFIMKLKGFFEANLHNPDLSLEDTCREMGMSRNNLYLKVQALTGQSVMQHLRNLRLEIARELLHNKNLSIGDVAAETGFSDPKFFSRAFSEAYGISPSHYRKQAV